MPRITPLLLVAVVVAGELFGGELFASSRVWAADRYALIIGNGRYQHIDVLANPTNDVKLVSAALERVGFDVETLLDASHGQMDDAALAFAKKLDSTEKAVGVFYFAGHGVSYRGENFLIPVEAKIEAGPQLKRRALSATYVLELMEDARNATDIMILDACRNVPFRSFSLSGTRSVSGGLNKIENQPRGSFIAYSTAPGAVAYDGSGDYSPFAEAFAMEIETPNVSIGDMMINVRNRVGKATAALGPSPQTPWDHSSLTGPFAFNPKGSVKIVPENVSAVVDNPPVRSRVDVDQQFWNTVSESNDPTELALYIDKFPNGQYVEIAKLRRQKLLDDAEPDVDPRAQEACKPYEGSEYHKTCLAEYVPGGNSVGNTDVGRGVASQANVQQQTWVDDEYNQWQVTVDGATFRAMTVVANMGRVELQGSVAGYSVSYQIIDATGQRIGYGQGSVTDATHIAVTSYWNNGNVLGATRFHVNHNPK